MDYVRLFLFFGESLWVYFDINRNFSVEEKSNDSGIKISGTISLSITPF